MPMPGKPMTVGVEMNSRRGGCGCQSGARGAASSAAAEATVATGGGDSVRPRATVCGGATLGVGGGTAPEQLDVNLRPAAPAATLTPGRSRASSKQPRAASARASGPLPPHCGWLACRTPAGILQDAGAEFGRSSSPPVPASMWRAPPAAASAEPGISSGLGGDSCNGGCQDADFGGPWLAPATAALAMDTAAGASPGQAKSGPAPRALSGARGPPATAAGAVPNGPLPKGRPGATCLQVVSGEAAGVTDPLELAPAGEHRGSRLGGASVMAVPSGFVVRKPQ